MTKKELIKLIASETELPQGKVEKVFDLLAGHIREAYDRDEQVKIRGFGTFCPKMKKSRMGVDFWRKEPTRIPARKVLAYRMSPLFCPKKEKSND